MSRMCNGFSPRKEKNITCASTAWQILTLDESVAPLDTAFNASGVDWAFLSRNQHLLPATLKGLQENGEGKDYENLHWYARLPN